MRRPRIGQLLSHITPITQHDIDEILHEQSQRHQLFGAIAIAMGFCQPQDVWKAWSRQIGEQIEQVDLDRLGVDAQATARLPGDVALRLRVLPFRMSGDRLIIATSLLRLEQASMHLPAMLPGPIKFVLADAQQIDSCLDRYYAGATARHSRA